MVMSGTYLLDVTLVRRIFTYPKGTSFSHAPDSDSSSENGEGASHSIYRSTQYPPRPGMPSGPAPPNPNESDEEDSSSSEEEEAAHVAPLPQMTVHGDATHRRSASSHSTHHNYRTPVGGSLVMTPAQIPPIPVSQPQGFETPSAFAGPSSTVGPPSSISGSAYGAPPPMSPPYASVQGYRRPPSAPGGGLSVRSHPLDNAFVRPHSTMALERAVEGVQAHLAALSERLDALEAHALRSSGGMISPRVGGSGPLASGRGSPYARRNGNGLDDLGLWSYVARLLLGCIRSARSTFAYVLSSEGRSPALIIVRRLFLDLSFILAVLALVRAGWRKSGVRRREIARALKVLWRAVVGEQARVPARALISRGV